MAGNKVIICVVVFTICLIASTWAATSPVGVRELENRRQTRSVPSGHDQNQIDDFGTKVQQSFQKAAGDVTEWTNNAAKTIKDSDFYRGASEAADVVSKKTGEVVEDIKDYWNENVGRK